MRARIRPATPADIPAMHRIRLAARENRLSDPGSVGEASYVRYVREGGAWVAESAERVVGFAAVDAAERSVWALFVDPRAEGRGIGGALHERMLGKARERGLGRLSLVTSPGTRAAAFYLARGWTVAGPAPDGELRPELALK